VPYIREDQAQILVTIDNVPYPPGVTSWKSAEGGNLEADDAKTRPGAMGQEVAIGGPGQRDDLTVAIQLTDVTARYVRQFENRVGVGTMKVGVTYLSPERVPIAGTSHTMTGILKAVNVSDIDSESSDAGMLELVMSCHQAST
jgi:hypothetical protein